MGDDMGAKNKRSSMTILNALGRVGWLEEIEKGAMKNEESAYIFPEFSCRRTCGWTHCNTRCVHQHRDSQLFSAPGISNGKTGSGFRKDYRIIRKAV